MNEEFSLCVAGPIETMIRMENPEHPFASFEPAEATEDDLIWKQEPSFDLRTRILACVALVWMQKKSELTATEIIHVLNAVWPDSPKKRHALNHEGVRRAILKLENKGCVERRLDGKPLKDYSSDVIRAAARGEDKVRIHYTGIPLIPQSEEKIWVWIPKVILDEIRSVDPTFNFV